MQAERNQCALAVPCHDAGIEDGVCKRKEQPGVIVDTVVISGGNKLCKQIPVSWRKLGVRTIGEYSAIIFCRSVSLALIATSSPLVSQTRGDPKVAGPK